ncbi:SurA N-terminal domain-containing protein [Hydrogenophaga sp. OTU3427]|uniref:SurA N-terminal domain-containing protein n=1 Tax=Hydrogenophaga sp. OTU3427 TaxID=3043856 RepID=UPI00313BE6ED
MFDSIRNHKKYLMGFLLLLIIPSFVLFGIDGYTRFTEGGQSVAQVAGKDIKQQDWDAAHRRFADNLLANSPNLDRGLLDTDQARYASLQRLVDERLLATAADKLRFATSDQRLARELQQDPTIATLRKPDGSLDMAQYRQLLSTQGQTPEMFEANVRADLSRRQVLQGVATSGFVTPSVSKAMGDAYFERRDIQWLRLAPADFERQVSVSDADVEKYYQANAAQFQSPEQADVEFVTLDLAAVAQGIVLNEADLRAYYEQNLKQQASTEQRRASHILLTVASGASADDKAKVKAKAEALLAQLKAAPGKFADIARAESQDPGSARNGGDLDYFSRGAMVKPFEDAAYALEKGQISGVVESEFGFHIIQLTDIKRPAQRSFEAMRAEMEPELKKQQAQRKFAEAAEQFSNLVYEQADSLAPAAEKLKLKLQTVKGLGRQGQPGVLSNPKLLTALFAADSVQKKRNTEAVETGPSQLTAARVVQYAPAATQPLAAVAAQVRARLVAERAAALAKADGEAKLAAWRKDIGSAKLPAAITVSRDKPEGLPLKVLTAALSADLTQAPVLVGLDQGREGYVLLRVNKAVPRNPPTAETARLEANELAQMWSSAEGAAYLSYLKTQFKAEVKAPKPGPAKPAS